MIITLILTLARITLLALVIGGIGYLVADIAADAPLRLLAILNGVTVK